MNIISHDHGPSSKTCRKNIISEMKTTFTKPFIKVPTPTRRKRFEQFMWQELYEEYLRHNIDVANAPIGRSTTEYFDVYCKDIPKEDPVKQEMLINQYPLYCTRAITVYNQEGDSTMNFKRRYSITRPVGEQREQFG